MRRPGPDGPEPWGLIDFDLAKPASRLLDVVITLRHWAPLSDPADRVPSLAELDAGRRERARLDDALA